MDGMGYGWWNFKYSWRENVIHHGPEDVLLQLKRVILSNFKYVFPVYYRKIEEMIQFD